MDAASKTLYIPLYGKALISRKGILLNDPKAEEIWNKEGFALSGKSKSKWLAYYMGMRCSVIDELARQALLRYPDSTVLHIGCGLDSRAERIKAPFAKWYDIDLPEVIDIRRRHFTENERCTMLEGNAMQANFLETIPEKDNAVIVMEGISMYLTKEGIQALFSALASHFGKAYLIMDAYTEYALKVSKRGNPIKNVGASARFGFDDPHIFEADGGFRFESQHPITPAAKVDELCGFEKLFFKLLFAGQYADKLYRLYTYIH